MRANLADELLSQLDTAAQLSGVSGALKLLVSRFQSYGVVLWEVAQGVSPMRGRRLFVQGQSFREGKPPPLFDLSMESISGRAILAGQTVNHWVLGGGGWTGPVKNTELLARLDIVAFATVPIQLHAEAGPAYDSALTFYRRQKHFTERELANLERAGRLFAMVYRAILGKVSLNLRQVVQDILRHAHFPSSAPGTQSEALAKETLGRVAAVVEQTFGNLETVLYLATSVEDERFHLIAERWPWSRRPEPSYKAGEDEGGTGWVLKTGRPLQILDMLRYREDKRYYADQYPGMRWSDRIDIAKEVRRLLRPGVYRELPPLSYVCVPILHENRILGALRCCVSRRSPYYFDDDLTRTLCSVADLIGDWWAHWMDQHKQATENTRLHRLLTSLNETNREALLQLAHPEKDPAKIVDLALKACSNLAPEVEVFQVWLKRPDRNELELDREIRMGEGSGTYMNRASVVRLSEVKLDDGRTNALVEVWSGRRTVHADSSGGGLALPERESCRCFTAAPIVVEQEPEGILVMVNYEQPYSRASVEPVAKFIAQQLALYLTLRRQLRALEEARKMQDDLLLNFQHQVRSPVNMAHAHAEMLLQTPHLLPPAELAGIIMEATRRASSVVSNLKQFVQLAQENSPPTKLKRIKPADIFKKLRSAARNLYSHKALNKQLEFEVDDSWGSEMGMLMVDEERLDLVFDNLLDNAVKYSFASTIVQISGGAADRSHVFFSFRSQGLPITRQEALRLGTRSQRGELARQSHPEGAGVGLWLAHQMLKSMRGSMQILPTNADGVTEFRIFLRRE